MIEFYRWETRMTRYELMFVRVDHPESFSKGWLVVGPWGFDTLAISNAVFIRDGSGLIGLSYYIQEKMGMKAWPLSCDGCAVAEMIASVLGLELQLPAEWFEQTPGRFNKEESRIWRQE